MTEQEVLNEVLVNKLEELVLSHNQLVTACQGMLVQINNIQLELMKLQFRAPEVKP